MEILNRLTFGHRFSQSNEFCRLQDSTNEQYTITGSAIFSLQGTMHNYVVVMLQHQSYYKA